MRASPVITSRATSTSPSAVANAATGTSARLTSLAGSCAGTSPLATSCLDAFLASFGRRAFRRPLDATEIALMKDVAQGTSPAPANAAEAIRNVVVMLLMSPRFVNHLELAGAPISGRNDYLALDAYEVASRLSYTFWQTLPDDALLAAAADGSLATDAGFDTQLDARVRRSAHARHDLAVLERVDALRIVHRLLVGAPGVHGAGRGREPGRRRP